MLSLEQIRSLESKVTKAVGLLANLQEENKILKSRLSQYETRIEELEFMIEEFKEEQGEIEQGIISALEHLDTLENAVGGLVQPAASPSRPVLQEKPVEQPRAQEVPQPVAPPVAVAAVEIASPDSNSENQDFFTEGEESEDETEAQGFKSENQQLDIF